MYCNCHPDYHELGIHAPGLPDFADSRMLLDLDEESQSVLAEALRHLVAKPTGAARGAGRVVAQALLARLERAA